MYSFENDYSEGCLPEILEALSETNLIQTTGYGLDQYCKEAEDLIKKTVGVDSNVFFMVGGTQANMTVISSILRPHEGVISAETGHINVHETGSIESTGHKVITIKGENGKLNAESIKAVLEEHFNDPGREHIVKPGMIYISNPTELGTIYKKSELESIRKVADEFSIPLFLDGARLGAALVAPANDMTLNDIGKLCDVFYIGGTKSGALFGEAIVFTNKKLSDDFRYLMKQRGGLLAKGRLLGIQFKTLFTDDLYFKAQRNSIDKAKEISKILEDNGYSLYAPTETNQIFPIVTNKQRDILRDNFVFEDWVHLGDKTVIRFVTSWATTKEAVKALEGKLMELA